MSNVAIRAALQLALDAVVPALSTSWENAQFNPVSGTPYQKVELLRARPITPTMDKFRQELGVMQVTLFYPLNAGTGAAEARAELIRNTFEKGNRYANSGVNVTIESSPHIMAGSRDGDRWMVPVRVPYFSNIS